MLKIDNLSVNYGNIQALKSVSLEVNAGEIITLLGANGAGKTTIMNTVAGLKDPKSGTIFYEGIDITKKSPRSRVCGGLVLAPEGRQVFPRFSVLDNLMMGGYTKTNEENMESLKVVYDLFPRLKEREKQVAGTLSGGEQQMLAVGRAMMSQPKLLLLDEPSLGLAPVIVKEIFDLIQRICSMGTTILLVEQNAKAALKISDRAYILQTGKIVLEGRAADLMESDEVRKAYLGGL